MLRPVEGAVIMLVCIFIGVLLEFSGGLVIDGLWNFGEDSKIFDSTPSEWNTYHDTVMGINLFHAVTAGISILGIVIFIITCLYREGSATEYSGYGGYYK